MFTIVDAAHREVATAETVTAARRLQDHHFRTNRAAAPFHYVPTEKLNRKAPCLRPVSRLRAWLSA